MSMFGIRWAIWIFVTAMFTAIGFLILYVIQDPENNSYNKSYKTEQANKETQGDFDMSEQEEIEVVEEVEESEATQITEKIFGNPSKGLKPLIVY